MKQRTLWWVGAAALCALAGGPAAAQQGAPKGEWPSYGGDLGSTKYAPLDQISKENVKNLAIAWRWNSPETEMAAKDRQMASFAHESTPLVVNGTLYTITSHCIVVALDPGTGEEKWRYDPESYKAGRPTNLGWIARGVAYWTDGAEERILVATGDRRLIALDAKTGKPFPDFGTNGAVDLTQGMRRPASKLDYSVNSPPIVCRDVAVVGSIIFDGPGAKEMSPGDVRGYDVRTGKQLWNFVSVPQEGEFGNDTWENESWKYTGNTNVWTLMSADDELDYVYLPFGTPTNDWYGGHRPGDGLFGETLVCVEAKTGRRVWHFQHVHHGVWDYDLPAAPALINVTVNGKPIRALAQITKQGFCWVLDRTNGDPLWPIEERAVPISTAPGEQSSPTQPFPTKPAPYAMQGVSEDSLIDFTPELREEAKEILSKFNYGPLYTPPIVGKPTINLPGWEGAGNWNGCAVDPETGIVYIPAKRSAIAIELVKPDSFRTDLDYMGKPTFRIEGPQGLPLWKAPYAYIVAIDLNTGEHLWQTVVGEGPRNHDALKGLNLPPLGDYGKGFPLLTKTLLFIGQEHKNKRFYAFDKATGEEVWHIELPYQPTGAPVTYMHNGKQFIVTAVGGRGPAELVALALP